MLHHYTGTARNHGCSSLSDSWGRGDWVSSNTNANARENRTRRRRLGKKGDFQSINHLCFHMSTFLFRHFLFLFGIYLQMLLQFSVTDVFTWRCQRCRWHSRLPAFSLRMLHLVSSFFAVFKKICLLSPFSCLRFAA